MGIHPKGAKRCHLVHCLYLWNEDSPWKLLMLAHNPQVPWPKLSRGCQVAYLLLLSLICFLFFFSFWFFSGGALHQWRRHIRYPIKGRWRQGVSVIWSASAFVGLRQWHGVILSQIEDSGELRRWLPPNRWRWRGWGWRVFQGCNYSWIGVVLATMTRAASVAFWAAADWVYVAFQGYFFYFQGRFSIFGILTTIFCAFCLAVLLLVLKKIIKKLRGWGIG